MFDAYLELPSWLRLILTGVVLCVGLFCVFFVGVRLGFLVLGWSLIMLIFGTRSQSEKNGYRF